MLKSTNFFRAIAVAFTVGLQACGGGSGGGSGGNSSSDSGPSYAALSTLAASSSISTPEDTSVSASLITNDSPSLSYALVQSPDSGQATIDNQRIEYTPTNDFNGSDMLVYRVSDGQETIEHTVTITVEPVNDSPTLAEQQYASTVAINEFVSLPVEAQDPDGDTLSYAITTQALNGEVSVDESGMLTYTPNPDFSGQDRARFEVTDPSGQSVAADIEFSVLEPLQVTHDSLAFTVEKKQAVDTQITVHNYSQTALTYSIALDYARETDAQSLSSNDLTPAPNQYLEVKKGAVDPRQSSLSADEPNEPDAYGYIWNDSNHSGGPNFVWNDIRDRGEEITTLSDDSVSDALSLGFAFPFYEQDYTSVYISSNGFIGFDPDMSQGCCVGQPLPSDDRYQNLIAWMWADLHPKNGTVHVLQQTGKYVIQFSNYGQFSGSGTVTAQVVLHANGRIDVLYHSFTNSMNTMYSSIGIENSDATGGLQVAFNSPDYLQPELALSFLPINYQWAEIETGEALLEPRTDRQIPLRIKGTGNPGQYQATITINNTDGESDTAFLLDLAADISPDESAPDSIEDLTVTETSFDFATVSWSAVADAGFDTTLLQDYTVRIHDAPITADNWMSAQLLDHPVESRENGQIRTMVIPELQPETAYYLAVVAEDENGNRSALSNGAQLTTLAPPVAATDRENIEHTLSQSEAVEDTIVLENNGEAALEYSIRILPVSEEGVSGRSVVSKTAIPQRKSRTLAALPPQGTYEAGQLIVRFKQNAQLQKQQRLASTANARVVKVIPKLNMQVWSIDPTSDMLTTINQLMADPSVLSAEPDYTLHALALPDDPEFPQLWGLHNTGQDGGLNDADIDAPEAWNILHGSDNVIVGVVDTGVDYTHPDLADNIWVNSGEIAGNGIDDDGNGFIDDVHGYDFVNDDGDSIDDNNHGTHVAGTIGAVGNNGIGISGVVHNVKLMGLKFLSAGGSGSTSDAIESIIYAVDNGATILNNSWGGGGYDPNLEAAIEYANANGVLFVAAAGNGGYDNDTQPSYPSNYEVDNVVAVAALDRFDELAGFSQYGATTVDIGAPGVDIYSTIPSGYASFNGTSMATPHVAGVAALIEAFSVDISLPELRNVLLESVVPVDALDGITVTGGRVNAFNAINLAPPPWLMIDPEQLSGQLMAGESTTITLHINAENLNEEVTYQRMIEITTNDPDRPVIRVPVTIVINPDTEAPARVDDLYLVAASDDSVQVGFTATGDDGYDGTAQAYDFRYSSQPIDEDNWSDAIPFSGIPSPAQSGEAEQLNLTGLLPATTYYIAMKVEDNFGLTSALSDTISFTTTYAELQYSPEGFESVQLSQGTVQTLTLELANTGSAELSLRIDSTSDFEARVTSLPQSSFESVDRDKYAPMPQARSQAQLAGAGGPDNFGYRWIDSDESHGPEFEWNDISDTGTRVNGLGDDVVVGPYPIGFDFPFYDQSYDEFYISSNGFISFSDEQQSGCCAGQPLPEVDRYNTLIAWLWYDLYPGQIYYQQSGNGDLIIQFEDYGEYSGNGSINAQIHLSEGGEIMLLYRDIYRDMRTDRASIGIENADSSDGLQVAFLRDYVKENLAIEISPGWLRAQENGIELAPGESRDIEIEISAASLQPGNYLGEVTLRSNDPDTPEVTVPVSVTVTP